MAFYLHYYQLFRGIGKIRPKSFKDRKFYNLSEIASTKLHQRLDGAQL